MKAPTRRCSVPLISSTRTTFARPLMNAFVASNGVSTIEKQIFIPTLSDELPDVLPFTLAYLIFGCFAS
jgi:hypothetical protein